MKKLFLLFNHSFTKEQEADAGASLGVEEIVPAPSGVAQDWSSIPPEAPKISPLLGRARGWLCDNARHGDYVLIQGDFGACCLMVDFALHHGLIPVYSTTNRQAEEQKLPDGSVIMEHRFKHVIFRRYEEC